MEAFPFWSVCLSAHVYPVLFCFQGQEQDVSTIIQALNECLDALPRQQLQRVGGIGVSGQMHGILFWKAGQGMLGVGYDLMLWSLNRPRTGLLDPGQVVLMWA